MGDLTKLIARVEALTGPCREVDARIAVVAGDYKLKHVAGNDTWAIFDAPSGRGKWAAASGMKSEADCIQMLSTFLSLRRFTASLDAAVALTERVLPDHEWSAGVKDGQSWGKVRVAPLHSIADEGPTPAIALILATLKAKQAQEANDA